MADDEFLEGIKTEDGTVLKNLAEMGERLKALHLTMLAAQAAAEQAEKEYKHYANVVVPMQMFAAGVDHIGLANGGALTIKHNYYCQPNKNDADRKTIVKWLRANGGDYIIEHDASVSAEDMDKLESNGIPFVENTSVNTNKLKSFIKDKIGATTGIQQIAVEDIPACIHFQEVTTVELTMPD